MQRVGTGTFLQLEGTLNNSGATLLLDDAGIGTLNLQGGTIIGGRIVTSGGAQLGTASPKSSNRPILDGVTLAGAMRIVPGAFVTARNGLILEGAAISIDDSGDDSGLLFDVNTPQTLSGTGVITFDGSNPSLRGIASGPGTLTIGVGVTIRTGSSGGSVGAEFGEVWTVLQGTIASESAGKVLEGYRLSNQGEIRAGAGGQLSLWNLKNQTSGRVSASNGGVLLLYEGFENQGTVRAVDSTVNLLTAPTVWGDFSVLRSRVLFSRGPFTTAQVDPLQASQSALVMAHTLNNSGATLNVSADRQWELAGGTITGGTIASIDGTVLTATGSGGLLQGVALDTDLRILGSATLTLGGTFSSLRPVAIKFSGGVSGTFLVQTGQVINGATFIFDATGSIAAGSGTLTLAADSTIRTTFGNGTIGKTTLPLVNQGLISSEKAGKTITLNGTLLTNDGTLRATNQGRLVINAPLQGAGRIEIGAGASGTARGGLQDRLDLAGTLQLKTRSAGGSTLGVKQLNLAGSSGAWSGKLDLADNALVIDYATLSPLSDTRAQIIAGWNGGAGNGNGITTSSSLAGRALGYGEASDLLGLSGSQTALWQGETVDATSVLVRYTLAGDADLSGSVDFPDLTALAAHYGSAGLWSEGDFNHDGQVNFFDLTALSSNYGNVLAGAVPTGAVDFSADLAAAFASVPEPGGALPMAAWGLALARGRGRRRG